MFQGFVANLHENVDAVAAERAVDMVERTLFCDEAFDAAVLVNIERTMVLRKGQ